MLPVTESFLNIFEKYRMRPTAVDQYESTGKQKLAGSLERSIAARAPIKFAMLGLPFKSTNIRDKVLGPLPDLGEELTIRNFEDFNNEVKQVYAPGIKIIVASDGYVFNDLLKVEDKVVDEYKEINESFFSNSTVDILDINDFYSGNSLSEKRDKLMLQFGYSWEKMQEEILFNPDVNMLYVSMIHFMEEELADKEFVSKNQLHKAAKKLTREMMLRNEAYNKLVRHELTDCIRLSMHQSVNNGYKYSFKLIPGEHTMHSPWHSTVVVADDEVITVHKKDAIAAGYELVYKNNQPYNFVK